MRILFVDSICNKPYYKSVLLTSPLGGAESSVIRLAEYFAQRAEVEWVEVLQHNCRESIGRRPRYAGFDVTLDAQPTHVIILRSPEFLRQIRSQFPNAKLYLWAHDLFQSQQWDDGFQVCADTRTMIICVSDWHHAQMRQVIQLAGFQGDLQSAFIYNPIDDELTPDGTPVEQEKLLFFSSPHKGLAYTLKVFEQFQVVDGLRDMKLYICNPGYFADQRTEGLLHVINLGSLSHSEAITHVRSSFAVLHLNTTYPETFGLVHVEANAVGTPFLAAPFGATPEICANQRQLVVASNPAYVIGRILAWKRSGRPVVTVNKSFRLSQVGSTWISLLSR